MESQVISTIELMNKGKVVHTIKIENLTSYEFVFDSKELSTLFLTTSNMNMDDLNMLVTRSYDSYVLIGVKKTYRQGKEQLYEIPPRVFKRVIVKENSRTVEITFIEKETGEDQNG